MARMKQYTFREMEAIVFDNGYKCVRNNGTSHRIYKKDGDPNLILLTKKKHVNACIAKRIIKEHNLKIDTHRK